MLLMLIRTVLMFLSRMVFVYTLGKTYLGVNGLMTNVLSMLSLAELGISTAINFSLYKPLAENDMEKVSVLMGFYKRAYQVIGCIVAATGMLLLPFIGYLVKGGEGIKDLQLIYLLYLSHAVSSYFIAYKETLINADQKNYKIAPFTGFFTFLIIVLQMGALLLFRSYLCYLVIQIVVELIQRLTINRYIRSEYPQVNFVKREKLPDHEKRVLTRNIKGMLFHKIGEYSIYGTDNIVISALIDIGMTGIYSNYAMLKSTVNSILNIVLTSATASFGELFASSSSEKQYRAFLRFDFLGVWLFGWSTSCLIILSPKFIELCFGTDYLMSVWAVLLVCLNFYMSGVRISVNIIKQAAGIYYEDRYVPLLQGIVNLVVSVVLAMTIGLEGVFIGTVVSGLLPQIIKPIILYRKCFPAFGVGDYFRRQMIYLGKIAVALTATVLVSRLYQGSSSILGFLYCLLVCTIIPNLIYLLLSCRSEEFLYYKHLAVEWCSGRRAK